MDALRFLPWIATILATLWACFVWRFLTIQPSGMLVLALVVGSLTIAAWLTTPRALMIELRKPLPWPARFCLIGTIIGSALIANTYQSARFSVLSGPSTMRFDLLPDASVLAVGVIAGYLIFNLYPCRKPHFVSAWLSVIGVAIGFMCFVHFDVWWGALLAAVIGRFVARWIIGTVTFLAGGNARASLPAARRHIV